jgi:26S proteasome regulatory subunit N1
LALLSDHVSNPSAMMRTGAILGLGLAYAGSAREDVQQLIVPTLEDPSTPIDIAATAALALGMIFVGTGNGEVILHFTSWRLTFFIVSDHSSYPDCPPGAR